MDEAEQKNLEIALREWLNCTMVEVEAIAHSGSDSSVAYIQGMTIAGILAKLTDGDPSKLMQIAHERAKHIFSSGQDWRRELTLWNNYNGVFWHGMPDLRDLNPAHTSIYAKTALEAIELQKRLEANNGET